MIIFHGYSEGQNVHVFRQLKEAADWLDLPTEVADKAFAEIRQRHELAQQNAGAPPPRRLHWLSYATDPILRSGNARPFLHLAAIHAC
jgi:hypothetical protein